MTPEQKKPMEKKLLEDDDLRKVSGGIKFHDPISGTDRGNDTVVPDNSESEENGEDNGNGGVVFVKPVFDPEG